MEPILNVDQDWSRQDWRRVTSLPLFGGQHCMTSPDNPVLNQETVTNCWTLPPPDKMDYHSETLPGTAAAINDQTRVAIETLPPTERPPPAHNDHTVCNPVTSAPCKTMTPPTKSRLASGGSAAVWVAVLIHTRHVSGLISLTAGSCQARARLRRHHMHGDLGIHDFRRLFREFWGLRIAVIRLRDCTDEAKGHHEGHGGGAAVEVWTPTPALHRSSFLCSYATTGLCRQQLFPKMPHDIFGGGTAYFLLQLHVIRNSTKGALRWAVVKMPDHENTNESRGTDQAWSVPWTGSGHTGRSAWELENTRCILRPSFATATLGSLFMGAGAEDGRPPSTAPGAPGRPPAAPRHPRTTSPGPGLRRSASTCSACASPAPRAKGPPHPLPPAPFVQKAVPHRRPPAPLHHRIDSLPSRHVAAPAISCNTTPSGISEKATPRQTAHCAAVRGTVPMKAPAPEGGGRRAGAGEVARRSGPPTATGTRGRQRVRRWATHPFPSPDHKTCAASSPKSCRGCPGDVGGCSGVSHRCTPAFCKIAVLLQWYEGVSLNNCYTLPHYPPPPSRALLEQRGEGVQGRGGGGPGGSPPPPPPRNESYPPGIAKMHYTDHSAAF